MLSPGACQFQAYWTPLNVKVKDGGECLDYIYCGTPYGCHGLGFTLGFQKLPQTYFNYLLFLLWVIVDSFLREGWIISFKTNLTTNLCAFFLVLSHKKWNLLTSVLKITKLVLQSLTFFTILQLSLFIIWQVHCDTNKHCCGRLLLLALLKGFQN